MIKGRRVDSCNVDDNFVYLTCGIHPRSWRSSTRPSPSLLSFRILSFVVGPWNWDTDFIVHFVGLFNNQTLYLSDKVANSPCVVEGDDVWISVLVLVVRLLTLLGGELVQARGSSEVKKGLRLFGLKGTFSFGWFFWEGGSCVPLCVGRGRWWEKKLVQANN